MITVALAKGALLKDSVARFAAAGLNFSAALDKDNRQLMLPTPCGRARALLVRNGDVPTYVAYGQAQLGVVGYDVLREHQLPVAQLVVFILNRRFLHKNLALSFFLIRLFL